MILESFACGNVVRLNCDYFLRFSLISLAGQIPGATPAIPGMFPTMFPLATGQVILLIPDLKAWKIHNL